MVSFFILRPFGPRRETAMLRAGLALHGAGLGLWDGLDGLGHLRALSTAAWIKAGDSIVASTLRRNNYGGPIVIQSANAEPSDCITYADAGADGTLAKGVLAATSAAELALIFWGRLAKGRKRSRT